MKTTRFPLVAISLLFIVATVTLSCNFPVYFKPRNSSFDETALMMIASRSMLDLYTPVNEQATEPLQDPSMGIAMVSWFQEGSKQQLNEQLALQAEFQRLADAAKEKGNKYLVTFYTSKAAEHALLAAQLEKKRADWRRNRRFFYVIKRGARAFGHAIGNIIDFVGQAVVSYVRNQISFYVNEIKSFLANPLRYTFDLSLQRQLQIIKNQLTNKLGPFWGHRAYDLINVDQSAWNVERRIFAVRPRKTPAQVQTSVVKPTDVEQLPEQTTESPIVEPDEATFIGNWHGPACDEAEGTYQYHWSVDLIQDPETDQYVGTIKFHACPGGGRVLYRVLGEPTTESLVSLSGVKKDGAGDLFANSPEMVTFKVNLNTGEVSP
ncbi:hypothetical protein EG832_10170, partial [bacterium]|nr:hypothetical protein [bacterium]